MKLLEITASYKPAFIYGGPTQSVSRLSEEMTRIGCDVQVLTTTANGLAELPVIPGKTSLVDGVKVRYFKRVTKDHSHYAPALLRHLRKTVAQYDVVHIHAWWNMVSVLACRIALHHKIPVVISPRGTLSTYSFGNRSRMSKQLLQLLLGKRLLAGCYFHVTAANEETTIRSLVQGSKIYNIPNFVNFPRQFTVQDIPGEGPFKLLFFSRIEEKKGLDILLDSLAGIDIPFTLTIAGDGEAGYIDRLKQKAAEIGIAGQLNWIGFQDEYKFKVLGGHELLVLPSFDENFGQVVIESLSVGTAVLVSDAVGLAGYVGAAQLGWVRQRNAEAFREELGSIYKDRARLKKIRAIAPGIVRRDFDENILAKKYFAMYNDIVNGSV